MNISVKYIIGLFAVSESVDQSSEAHWQLIGYTGLLLPLLLLLLLLLWLIAGWRPTEGL